jgi:hypothetical protein
MRAYNLEKTGTYLSTQTCIFQEVRLNGNFPLAPSVKWPIGKLPVVSNSPYLIEHPKGLK